MKKKVENALIELGIAPNLLGFDYICNAIEIISNSKEKPTVGMLYACVAKNFGSSTSKVERAIRHAFTRIDFESESYKKYIGAKDMTNGALLFTLYTRLKED